MLNRPLPAPARDVAILIGRVILGVVLFAHGWQKLVINGIAGTYGQFEKLGIPLAIVSASFASFVEFVGGVLIILGALTTTVVALDLVVMVGAAGFVHITHGVFAQDGGWELVGVIVAAELALAAFGPGQFSVDHLITRLRERERNNLRQQLQKPVRRPVATSETFTPAVAASAAPSYPTGGFAAIDQAGWPLASRREEFPPPAGNSSVTVGDALATGALPVISVDRTPAGVFAASATPSTSIFATPDASTPSSVFAAPSSVTTPTDVFAVNPSVSTPTGAFAAVSPSSASAGRAAADVPAEPPADGFAGSATHSTSTGSHCAAASVAASTVGFPVVSDARAADPAAPTPAAGRGTTESSPRMVSAGVQRAMSERAGRQASVEPAPFGVTVQSPLDFTPTTAMPVVPPLSAPEMIAVAAAPGGLPRRGRHTPDLPRASAIRPYA